MCPVPRPSASGLEELQDRLRVLHRHVFHGPHVHHDLVPLVGGELGGIAGIVAMVAVDRLACGQSMALRAVADKGS